MAALARRRPAETTGAAGALAVLAARLAGVRDPDAIAAAGAAAATLPAAVTWITLHGGLRGLARALWRGRP